MTRKRFNKLMMAVGIPKKDLAERKLEGKGKSYLDVLGAMAAYIILDKESSAVDKASAMMMFKAIRTGKMKGIGKAFHTVCEYNRAGELRKTLMDYNANAFIEKYREVFDVCVEVAKEIVKG